MHSVCKQVTPGIGPRDSAFPVIHKMNLQMVFSTPWSGEESQDGEGTAARTSHCTANVALVLAASLKSQTRLVAGVTAAATHLTPAHLICSQVQFHNINM